jgi:hypothetical protein
MRAKPANPRIVRRTGAPALWWPILRDGNTQMERDIAGRNPLLITGAGTTAGDQGATLSTSTGNRGVSQSPLIFSPIFTVACRVVSNVSLQESFGRILETSFADWFFLGSDAAGTAFLWIVNNSGASGATGGTIVQGVPTVLHAVYDGTTSYLYVNGALVATFAATAPSPVSEPLWVGENAGSPGFVWGGTIGDVRYWTRPLSASEVRRDAADPWRRLRRRPTVVKVPAASPAVVYPAAVLCL